jgi:L-ascorbate metabolism protein UlaG (beta-lactamase superfamily)
MQVSHINPEDAVKAFLELKADSFIPMHYGAWCRQRKPAVTAKMFRQALMLSGFQEVMQADPTRRAVSHINPEDAVKAFLELKADSFIPMHYGAFRLADDHGNEAVSLQLQKRFHGVFRIDM